MLSEVRRVLCLDRGNSHFKLHFRNQMWPSSRSQLQSLVLTCQLQETMSLPTATHSLLLALRPSSQLTRPKSCRLKCSSWVLLLRQGLRLVPADLSPRSSPSMLETSCSHDHVCVIYSYVLPFFLSYLQIMSSSRTALCPRLLGTFYPENDVLLFFYSVGHTHIHKWAYIFGICCLCPIPSTLLSLMKFLCYSL